MKSRIQKWGNSLALRIPKPLAAEIGLGEDSPVELSVRNGELLVGPVIKSEESLEHLLSQITPENLHREIDAGPAVGGQVW